MNIIVARILIALGILVFPLILLGFLSLMATIIDWFAVKISIATGKDEDDLSNIIAGLLIWITFAVVLAIVIPIK